MTSTTKQMRPNGRGAVVVVVAVLVVLVVIVVVVVVVVVVVIVVVVVVVEVVVVVSSLVLLVLSLFHAACYIVYCMYSVVSKQISTSTLPLMALNSLYCGDVLLSSYSLN